VLSTAQNTQRDSQSYVEMKRGRKEVEVTWRRKETIKRGERGVYLKINSE